MGTITVDTINDQFVIKVNKGEINKERLLQFIEYLRIESMAEKINFSEDIEELGKEIKATWWKNNKDTYIPREHQ